MTIVKTHGGWQHIRLTMILAQAKGSGYVRITHREAAMLVSGIMPYDKCHETMNVNCNSKITLACVICRKSPPPGRSTHTTVKHYFRVAKYTLYDI